MNATNPQAAAPAADTRFQKGNLGGPGNPYARQCAQFRKALHAMVTEDAIQDLAADLLRMARSGNLAALKLLFAYVIGKPTPAPDLTASSWRTGSSSRRRCSTPRSRWRRPSTVSRCLPGRGRRGWPWM